MIAALALTLCLPAAGDTWTPPAEWLDRTMQLESSGNAAAVGDFRNGKPRSRGPYQISEKVWYAYGGTAPWRTHAHDPGESRRIAALILRDCARACRRHGQAVTFANVRFFYTRGGF